MTPISRRLMLAATTAATAATGLKPRPARAADKVRIGFITTLSTPGGYLGADERDGFQLALNEGGGALGGIPAAIVVQDDAAKPASGRQIADAMLSDGIRLFSGVNFSNVLEAVVPAVMEADGFYVSLNPGPSTFAGARCNRNYFVASYQNDTFHEASGLAANVLGYKDVTILAPNYQAGRDAATGFKRAFKGKIAEEIFVRIDQTDFSVELARLRQTTADGLFVFLAGGAGINFVKQYAASGLRGKVGLILAPFVVDAQALAATGNAAEGVYSAASWSTELDVPRSREFVASFRKAYGRIPTVYAAHAYDTAYLIGSALQAVDGDFRGKPDAFRAALFAARFPTVRTRFSFASNHSPILDFFLLQVGRNDAGELVLLVRQQLASDWHDSYADACKMAG